MLLSEIEIRSKVLRDRYNSIVFEKGRGKVYLVGGYVRDILRGIKSQDRDYIVFGNLRSFVNDIKRNTGGSVVEFKTEGTIRIAFTKGVTLDFSSPIGTLGEDLSRRDFTINAMAWYPQSGLIDLYNGIDDLNKKRICLVSKENMISDPLRMLRAYRFAAELEGSLDERTRNIIKTLHNNIKDVSHERITLELFNLLNSNHPAKYLTMALSDRLLNNILLLPDNILENNIRAISKLEHITFKCISSNIKALLKKSFSQNLTYKGLLCLELIMRQHHSSANMENINLRLSNIIRKRIAIAHRGIRELHAAQRNLKEKLFDVFKNSGEASLDILIISNRLDLLTYLRRYTKIIRKGILSSEEIINTSGINPGPELGNMILQLQKAQFEKRVNSKSRAIKFIREIRGSV